MGKDSCELWFRFDHLFQGVMDSSWDFGMRVQEDEDQCSRGEKENGKANDERVVPLVDHSLLCLFGKFLQVNELTLKT